MTPRLDLGCAWFYGLPCRCYLAGGGGEESLIVGDLGTAIVGLVLVLIGLVLMMTNC